MTVAGFDSGSIFPASGRYVGEERGEDLQSSHDFCPTVTPKSDGPMIYLFIIRG